MTSARLRRTVRRLVPPITRRDEMLAERTKEIRRLKRKVDRVVNSRDRSRNDRTALRASLQRASFGRSIDDLRRSVVSLRAVDPEMRHPLRHLPFKLRNYRLARTHGIAVPRIFAAWSAIDEVLLADLPDEFVLKSDGGAGGHGVLPLRRRNDGCFDLVNTHTVLSEDDVRERLRDVKSISGPYFAEELLHAADGGAIPVDVKIFGFYGEIGQVLLRRVDEHGNLLKTYYRFVDEHGVDLQGSVWDRRLDPSILLPTELTMMIDAARHLSSALGLPFVRVDVYGTSRGMVFGELTRVPGGSPRYSPEHDEFMGSLYENARWRVERDIMAGRPPGILHGMHEAPNPYPADHISQQEEPGPWAVKNAECPWCVN